MGSSAQVLKKQLQTFKHQVEQLSQFVIRLSKFYEGANPELDKELQILRSHLGGQSNFTMTEISMGKLTGLILRNSDSFKKQKQKAVGLIEEAVKGLQSRQNVPDLIKNQASQFLLSLSAESDDLFSSLPQFETALNIYQQALDNAEQFKQATGGNADKGGISLSQKLHEQISQELRELIDQLSSSRAKDKQLQEVRSQLIKGIDHQELLECCLMIIRAIIREVVKERKHAEKFVSSLHSSLSKVNKSVERSIDDAETQFQQKQKNNESLRAHLTTMEDVVDSTNDIALLKQKATEQLQKMASTLDNREQSEQQEQQTLMTLLNEMKDQLTNLEQETADYKHRLIEQKYNSHHDPLTQIPNRTAYNERIEMEYKRWRRSGADLCLAVIDVDHFKRINDNYGHAGGDKTLQVLAQNISRCLRSTDFLARWGGEEFIVLFPQTPVEELDKPLQTIRRQIERIPFKFREQKVSITVSIGASNFVVGDNIDSVFERADQSLYQAKHAGRNRCVITQG